MDLGSPMTRAIFDHNKYFPFIFGLSSFGDDCGFGTPIVATKVSAYIDWIDSIMFSSSNAEKNDNNGPEIEAEFEGKCMLLYTKN
jgi:secreted trypsin-like serine protease